MIKLILFITIFSLGNGNSLLDRALSDFRDHSYFISLRIKIKSSNTTKQLIIENDDLYRYLKKYEKLNTETYASMLRKKLVSGKILKLKEVNSDFKEVVNLDTVNENAKKGKDHFFKTYFTESGVIKKE